MSEPATEPQQFDTAHRELAPGAVGASALIAGRTADDDGAGPEIST